MAKKTSMVYKLVSSVGTGFFYVGKKNKSQVLNKVKRVLYDPVVQRHVIFNESKLKSSKKR